MLFDKDETTLIACPAGKTSVMLPISVTDIGSSAFYGCDKLMVINLPENVRNIADQAFAYCRNLTNLVLPEGATEVGDYTFQGCEVLTKVIIPASVTKIGTGIFKESPLGTIYGVYGSYAETYANANNIPFVGSDVPAEGDFTAFLGQDPTGNYYEYKVDDFNNAYLAYQIKPSLPSAKMYQQFLNSQCQIVALKDLTKGYMDYNGAATASLLAQMKGEAFDINVYSSSIEAKKFEETVENVKIVDKDGNVL